MKFLSVHTVLEEEKKEKGIGLLQILTVLATVCARTYYTMLLFIAGGTAVRALSFDGGRDHSSGDRKYMLYIPLGVDEELSVSCGRG